MAFCKDCDNQYSDKRAALGYKTCLDCGSPKINPILIPIAKSNYVVGTLQELQNNNHKGPRYG